MLLSFLPIAERRFIACYSLRFGAHRPLQGLLLDFGKLAFLSPLSHFILPSFTLLAVAFSFVLEMFFLLCRLPVDLSDSLLVLVAFMMALELLLVCLAMLAGSQILRMTAGRNIVWSWISLVLWGMVTVLIASMSSSLCVTALLNSNGSGNMGFIPECFSMSIVLFSGVFMQVAMVYLCMLQAQRMPLDTEGESELITGLSLEYGGIMFACFGAVEYGLALVALVLMVQWNMPGVLGISMCVMWMCVCLIRVKAGRVKVVMMWPMLLCWCYVPLLCCLVFTLLFSFRLLYLSPSLF